LVDVYEVKMTEHKMVYGISGALVTEPEIVKMKAGGIADFWQVVHAGAAPDPEFVAKCVRQGVTPCFQNGNDGVPGWDGTAMYYQRAAAAGYPASGGESEQRDEIHAIMDNQIFGNFGGDFGGCTEGFSDLFYGYHPMAGQTASGHGISSWLETYTTSVELCYRVVDAAINAKKHGSREAGFMIGNWMPVTAAPYIAMAKSMEAQGYICDGFNVWLGHGSRMWDTYQKWRGVLDELMAIWPPDMRTMKDRFAGETPPIVQTPDKIVDTFYSIAKSGVFDVVGKVLDTTGKPINKQKVILYRNFNGPEHSEVNRPVGDALTKEDGIFYFYPRDLQPGMYEFKPKAGNKMQSLGRIFVRSQ
jgi:hypothetical protein